MDNNIDQILAELYQSDPSLKQHEDVLRKVVIELMQSKPESVLDDGFKHELRRRLLTLQENQEIKYSPSNFMNRFQLLGAGVAFVALLAVSVWYLNGTNPFSTSSLTSMVSGPKITKADDNAFGALSNVQVANGRGGANDSASENLSVAPTAGSSMGSGSGMSSDSKLIAPTSVNFRYVYKGEELTLGEDKVDVLRRIKNEQNGDLSDFISRISLGIINLDSFSNRQVQNFSFIEDKDQGYTVNVNLTEGTININESTQWAIAKSTCAVEISARPCEQQNHNISEVPSDENLIATADAFLNDHGIDKSIYGSPFVNKDWRQYYEQAEDKANYWIPDTMTVVYPLVINNQQVFDESGNLNGLNISIRYTPAMEVSGVWELNSQNYQSSSYEAETNVSRIMGLLEKGGFRNYYYSDPNGKTVDLELGTPEISYVKIWNYNYNDNTSEELLVPALIFPVTNTPTDIGPYGYYRKNVVIPLVKEILDSDNSGVIMPLMDVKADVVNPVPAR